MELWVLVTLASAITYALAEIVGKKFLSKYDISPRQLMIEEYFLTLFILLFFFFPYLNFYYFYTHYYLFILKALFLSIATFTYMNLLKKHDLSQISPLMNLSPIALVILSSLLLSETISMMQFLGIVVIIIGTFVLEVHKHHHHHSHPHNIHLQSLIKKPSSFFIAVVIMLVSISLKSITDKELFKQGVDIYTNLYFSALIIFVMISVYYIYEKKFFTSIKKMASQPQTFLVGLIKIIDTALVLIAISQPFSKISLIVPLRRSSTLASLFFGGLLFHEKHLAKKLFAASIMILGIFMIVM
jgi:drug/metabolite transporter (DMT)-like permease